MSFREREEKIIDILYNRHSIKNSDLARILYVSPATMRRDLDDMEKRGLIVRKYGECILSKKTRNERKFFLLQEQEQSFEKQSIAEKAVKRIENGDRIMLDGSTIVCNMVHLLDDFDNLLVITNNVKASFLLGMKGIDNISTGGRMKKNNFTLYGQGVIDSVQNYNADIVFFSCDGINEDGYVTDDNIDSTIFRKEMIKHSKKKVLLCTKNKIGKQCLHNLCHITELDEVICEEQLPDWVLKQLKNVNLS